MTTDTTSPMQWSGYTQQAEEQWRPTNERQKVTTHTSWLGARILSLKHLLEMSLQLKEEIRKNGVCSSSELSPFLLREDGIWPPGPIWPANGFFYIPWTDARRPLITQVSNFPILGLQIHPLWRTGAPGEEPSQSLVEQPRAEMGTYPTLPHPVQLCSKDFISRFVH